MRRSLLVVVTMVFVLVLGLAGPASASLFVEPGNASEAAGDVHGDDVVAEAPVEPQDFEDRGASMNNPAEKLAAWEAHINSQVIDGP